MILNVFSYPSSPPGMGRTPFVRCSQENAGEDGLACSGVVAEGTKIASSITQLNSNSATSWPPDSTVGLALVLADTQLLKMSRCLVVLPIQLLRLRWQGHCSPVAGTVDTLFSRASSLSRFAARGLWDQV